jgi:mRNA interferase RelE/StbE
MMFTILYHERVVSRDIPALAPEWKDRIKRAIAERLTSEPALYGKPLRRSLKGYWKLRVSDYRVIFRIEKNTVKILVIQHRSVVYDQAERRI